VRGCVLVLLCVGCHRVPRPTEPAVDVEARVREAREMSRVRTADVAPVLDLASARVTEFFDVRFGRVDAFVGELFGWRGKWRAAFWGREDYERWVRRAFERRLLSAPEFEREVAARVREDAAFAWSASESRLMADVHALVRRESPSLTLEPFAAEVRALAEELRADVARDAGMNVASIAASEAAALGAAWALAGALAANAWWNAGVSLVIGVVVAAIIDATAGEAGEDAARARVHAELVWMRRRAVDAVVGALAGEWLARAERREAAVAAAVERSLR